jgi:hypothetical protein
LAGIRSTAASVGGIIAEGVELPLPFSGQSFGGFCKRLWNTVDSSLGLKQKAFIMYHIINLEKKGEILCKVNTIAWFFKSSDHFKSPDHVLGLFHFYFAFFREIVQYK